MLVAILGLTAEERGQLGVCLRRAIASDCIPEWEFAALVGCSHAEALSWVEAGLPAADLDEGLLDQVVTMLSLLAGSGDTCLEASTDTRAAAAQVSREQLDQLLEKLCWAPDERRERSQHHSGVTVRAHPSAVGQRAEAKPVLLPARRAARKRPG
jgi:hypothetical protein